MNLVSVSCNHCETVLKFSDKDKFMTVQSFPR